VRLPVLRPYGKMLLLLFFSEENQAPLKCIDAHGYSGMALDAVPRFGHGRAPMDIVKNQYGIVVAMREELLEIMQGCFL